MSDRVAPHDHLSELSERIADQLLDRTLPKSRWTHEGHLLACVALVRRHGPSEALVVLRAAIPPYNLATGVANTTTGGYHDTITVYYVWVVDRLLRDGCSAAEVLWSPLVARDAPLRWWDRETLMSSTARAAWLPPTIGDGDAPHEWTRSTTAAR